MVEVLLAGGDRFGSAIKLALNKRNDVKIKHFIDLYGSNTKALKAAIGLGIKPAEAVKVFKKFKAAFPALEEFAERYYQERKESDVSSNSKSRRQNRGRKRDHNGHRSERKKGKARV